MAENRTNVVESCMGICICVISVKRQPENIPKIQQTTTKILRKRRRKRPPIFDSFIFSVCVCVCVRCVCLCVVRDADKTGCRCVVVLGKKKTKNIE